MKRVFSIFAVIVAAAFVNAGAKVNVEPPQQSPILSGYSTETVKSRIQTTATDPVEGIWEFPEDRVTVSVEKCSDGGFSHRLVILESDDIETVPGTVLGYIADSGLDNEFNLWIYSDEDENGILSSPVKCYARLSNDFRSVRIIKSEIKPLVRINFARLLPGFFKGVYITLKNKPAQTPVGLRKIYPEDTDNTNKIIYL